VRSADYLGIDTQSVIAVAIKGAAGGKTAWLLDSADQPHSWAHVPDVAATLVAAALAPDGPGRLWITPSAPARTQEQTIADLAAAGGWGAPRVRVLPGGIQRLGGLALPLLREIQETRVERTGPFTVDGSETTARLGVEPTAWVEVCAAVATRAVEPV
jgi:nucleoside-diphosphate-sugar epimerase